MFAGNEVWVNMDKAQCRFVLCSLVEDGEENVRIIDSKSGDFLITDKWNEMADFIREKWCAGDYLLKDNHLYTLVLTKVAVAYLFPDPEMQIPSKERAQAIIYLAEEEPLLKKVLRHVF